MQTLRPTPNHRSLALLCAVGLLALLSLPPVTAAQDSTVPDLGITVEPAAAGAVVVPTSLVQGQEILWVTLSVAGLLVGMERLSAWWLAVCRRAESLGVASALIFSRVERPDGARVFPDDLAGAGWGPRFLADDLSLRR